MSLISRWYSTTLVKDTDSQNTPEVDLQDSFEAIEIDIPTIEAAEVQIKGANESGATFDLIGQEEPVASSTGGFRTTVPLGGKYQFIKVYLSAAQTSDRVFAVRGISYASAGLVALADRFKGLLTGITLAANSGVDIGDVDVLTEPSGDGTYTTPTHTAPSIGSSTTTALAANASRLYAMFINDSDEVIYLKLGASAVLNEGIRLNANGGSYEMSKKIGNLYTGVVNGICTSGDKVCLVCEGV